ncbi:MAG: hypothetical protein JKY94_07935 [Rhodobacteraceae bacterium]|nr:hypothetical protein [Paracoccaceae bacterium]
MPLRFPDTFKISEITRYPEPSNFTAGVVTIKFEEEISPDNFVSNGMKITVRIPNSDYETMDELEQALYSKSIYILKLATSKTAGKTAKDLLEASAIATKEPVWEIGKN